MRSMINDDAAARARLERAIDERLRTDRQFRHQALEMVMADPVASARLAKLAEPVIIYAAAELRSKGYKASVTDGELTTNAPPVEVALAFGIEPERANEVAAEVYLAGGVRPVDG
jgi:hypothetical protein